LATDYTKILISAGDSVRRDEMRARAEYKYKPALQRRSITKPFMTPRFIRSKTVGLSGDPRGPMPNKE
jgi:hypothetical protein